MKLTGPPCGSPRERMNTLIEFLYGNIIKHFFLVVPKFQLPADIMRFVHTSSTCTIKSHKNVHKLLASIEWNPAGLTTQHTLKILSSCSSIVVRKANMHRVSAERTLTFQLNRQQKLIDLVKSVKKRKKMKKRTQFDPPYLNGKLANQRGLFNPI